jgi:hypothetical protein
MNSAEYRIEHPCPICKKIFTTTDSVHVHQFLVHHIRDPRMKVMTCTECGKEFVKRTAFENHLVSHAGLKPHPCPFCDKRFITYSNVADHTKKVHLTRIQRFNADAGQEMTEVNGLPVIGRGPGYVITAATGDGSASPYIRPVKKKKRPIQIGVPKPVAVVGTSKPVVKTQSRPFTGLLPILEEGSVTIIKLGRFVGP